MADWDRLSPERCLNLADGLKLSPQNVHSQADKRIRSGIRRQNLMQADRVMPASNRDGARQTDESPDILQSFVCRWKGCYGKYCLQARNQKACPRPHSNSVFHAAAPDFSDPIISPISAKSKQNGPAVASYFGSLPVNGNSIGVFCAYPS
jgi:hypothetical protein